MAEIKFFLKKLLNNIIETFNEFSEWLTDKISDSIYYSSIDDGNVIIVDGKIYTEHDRADQIYKTLEYDGF